MPELKCGVITCRHNQHNYCDLDAIEVIGSDAKEPRETSCGSFAERKENEYTNSTKEPSLKSDVKCRACECKYNDDCVCHAGEINVAGTDAKHTEETKCATFRK